MKEQSQKILDLIADLKELPPSRETSIAITNLEQALLWLNKGSLIDLIQEMIEDLRGENG